MAIIRPFRSLPPIVRKEYNLDFVDYVWYKNLFNEVEVKNILSLWDSNLVKEAEVNADNTRITRDDLRKSEVMFIAPSGNEWVYDKLSAACIQANSNRYKFEITGFQTELQLASYGPQQFFEWHMDFGTGNVSNRKLSISVQLSDPDEYEGGELQFMINQNIFTATKEKGTAIIFPSFGLHRVTPVTKGVRKSIVGWISGPPYR
ncbi:MAG: 2OG-Fe(II) oxygenase [Bacteroidetes bacterium]|nr:2OG-Fe(II) oxygenase [Bacteroidota bacterium]MBK9798741.1 2OG-Fe(II) oxygenase [Bacteroidota bacterium]MBP6412686.1 2OG-Fe(II) oxygenase [Bacteroidia bacterium]